MIGDPSYDSHPSGNTGRFVLLSVRCHSADRQEIQDVLEVSALCGECKHQFTASQGEGLNWMKGGAVIECVHCGNRQAISSDVFHSFKGVDCLG